MSEINVSLAPPVIGNIGPVQVTNAMFSAITVSLILIIFSIIVRRKLSMKPGRIQIIVEMLVTLILSKMTMAFGSEERAKKFFPLIFTVFIFILFANYFTLIPFIETIMTEDGVSIFTTATAHYSQTIALGLFVLGISHIIAFFTSPLRHIGAFIKLGPLFKARSLADFGMAIIEIFLGLLDIVGEFAKIISMTTRLFGNLLAGGVIVGIISSLTFATKFGAPIFFIVLGLLSGFVQAFVFSMLGLLFVSSLQLTVKPNEEAEAQPA